MSATASQAWLDRVRGRLGFDPRTVHHIQAVPTSARSVTSAPAPRPQPRSELPEEGRLRISPEQIGREYIQGLHRAAKSIGVGYHVIQQAVAMGHLRYVRAQGSAAFWFRTADLQAWRRGRETPKDAVRGHGGAARYLGIDQKWFSNMAYQGRIHGQPVPQSHTLAFRKTDLDGLRPYIARQRRRRERLLRTRARHAAEAAEAHTHPSRNA